MNVLSVNSGSSSLRWGLFDPTRDEERAKGRVEEVRDPATAWASAAEVLAGLTGDRAPDAVGHRVVHGGERFADSVVIDDDVLGAIEAQVPLAPDHNPRCLHGIRAAQRLFPDVPHVAVFDTAFHQTMPREAIVYPIPYEYFERDRIRRYGFHGTSHRHAVEAGARLLGVPSASFDGITCHLGNGCSIAAISQGRCVDTSMGMTPLEGLMMGTRSGDVDPGIVLQLAGRSGLGAERLAAILSRESGLLGVSGVSSDLREVEAAAADGHDRALLALEVFAHRVRRGLGAALGVLGGASAIVVTGGIGEHAVDMRSRIFRDLTGLGVELDEAENRRCVGGEGRISRLDSAIAVFVVPAREEWLIARETAAVLERAEKV